jgi:predicted RNA-binding protein with PUA-like domain
MLAELLPPACAFAELIYVSKVASRDVGFWLFKQEPSTYSYSDLEKDRRTVWDGVSNNLALKHLRAVQAGDKVFLYHSGSEKSIVGIMEAISSAYELKGQPVVDVRPVGRLAKPVSLALIKADPSFSQWELVRISRLSVMPVPKGIWAKILKMAGM